MVIKTKKDGVWVEMNESEVKKHISEMLKARELDRQRMIQESKELSEYDEKETEENNNG